MNDHRKYLSQWTLGPIVFAALLSGPSQALAQGVLGSTLETFSVLGASTVTNTGATTLTGNLGVFPGTAITGQETITINTLPALTTGSGFVYPGTAFAALAQVDLTNARTSLGLLAPTSNLTGQNLGGLTLTSGVYDFDTSAQLTGTHPDFR